MKDLSAGVHHADTPFKPLSTSVASLTREQGPTPLRIEGQLPMDLRGTYLRNGPAVFDGVPNTHWFDANGAVVSVRLDGGAALGSVKEMHAPSYEADRLRPRLGGFARRMSIPQRIRALFGAPAVRNVANVNLLAWQDRLFALYESALPLELNPQTLELIAESDLDGLILGAWNAHPRRVPARRTTYQFGLRIGPRSYLDIYELPDCGAGRKLTSIRMPFVTAIHDCLATERYLLFFVPPWGTSALRLLAKGAFVEALSPRPGSPTRILIVPIDEPDKVRVVETDPFFSFHGFNAYERSGEIIFDFIRYRDFESAHAHVEATTQGGTGTPLPSEVVRGVIDPRTNTAKFGAISQRPCEFPRIADAFHGQPHRWGWTCGFDTRNVHGRGWFDRILAHDLKSGAVTTLHPGPKTLVGEPTVVPRSHREDDVWILAMLNDVEREASCLAVWDGRSSGDEPIARAWFDQLLPPGLHGGFYRR